MIKRYDALWRHVRQSGAGHLVLSFDEIGRIAGVPIDHSFLHEKKALEDHGYRVEKISLKEKWVAFRRMEHVDAYYRE